MLANVASLLLVVSTGSPGYKSAKWGAPLGEVKQALELGAENSPPGLRGGSSSDPTQFDLADLPTKLCLLKSTGARYDPVWRFTDGPAAAMNGTISWSTFGPTDEPDGSALFFLDGKFRGIQMRIASDSSGAVAKKLSGS